MTSLASDQAESLRRMLAPRATRRIAVVASDAGAGATTVALGLANALALQGERVLLIDEDRFGARATRLAGAMPEGTLAAVLGGAVTLDAALGKRPAGTIAVLPGSPQANGDLQLLKPFRTVLSDARSDADGGLSQMAGTAHNLIVVLRAEPASIKAAYACIKQLNHLYACRRFHLVINAAAGDAANAVLGNLARTASHYLGVEASPAGSLPHDPLVARSTALGRCVVEAFPAAPATAALRRIATGIASWPMSTDPRSTLSAPMAPSATALA
ncbi:flagellar biosynthesis protein FlhG [Cupriavidus sp. CV2]|uniref:MinD/ParA family ATP-binding protein n=1 Tax=Cupriavidus ulmosensis TaxID=3065913 RepID=UPI00296B3874|nr:flagellar biosynthesis protein FlhG [Cupriavidus sp. CV2]MDW3689045.1 flagellar biosynthesis protein FlhG [Cupriavidus sp. CV2]